MLVQDLHGIHGAYYLYRAIKVPAGRKMDVSITADDFFKLWVNGKQVAERARKPKLEERDYKVAVESPPQFFVECFGSIGVGHRDDYHFEFHVHELLLHS